MWFDEFDEEFIYIKWNRKELMNDCLDKNCIEIYLIKSIYWFGRECFV